MLCISHIMTITQSFITNSLTSEDMFIELIRFCVLLNFDSHLAKLNLVCRWCNGYQMERIGLQNTSSIRMCSLSINISGKKRYVSI